jgi:hypothetical protein
MANPIPPEDLPGNHPDPPTVLDADSVATVVQSGPWYRLNTVQHPSALYFDTSGCGRFDGPQQSYGILYLGADIHTCFIECFGRTHTKAVDEAELKTRNLFAIQSQRPLKLADLTGAGLVRLGADSRLTTGNYTQSRKWGQAIWEIGQAFDGIRYRARLDNDRYCYGLFDRATSVLEEQNQGNLVDSHPHELARILGDYGYALL